MPWNAQMVSQISRTYDFDRLICKSLQYVKNNLHKKFLKSKSVYTHAKFKLNHLLKISKRKYYDNSFFENINDSKKIGKGVKQIVIFKPQTSSKQIILPLEECELRLQMLSTSISQA